MRVAALVCSTFHLDPILFLTEPDPVRRDLRLAAHNIVNREAAKAARRQQQ